MERERGIMGKKGNGKRKRGGGIYETTFEVVILSIMKSGVLYLQSLIYQAKKINPSSVHLIPSCIAIAKAVAYTENYRAQATHSKPTPPLSHTTKAAEALA